MDIHLMSIDLLVVLLVEVDIVIIILQFIMEIYFKMEEEKIVDALEKKKIIYIH